MLNERDIVKLFHFVLLLTSVYLALEIITIIMNAFFFETVENHTHTHMLRNQLQLQH